MVSTSPEPKEVFSVDECQDKGPPRRAKWWYSTFHTVTAMVGAGVLSLPYAMAYLGWGPGTVVMILSWCITLNTMWQMIQLHECVPGTRFDRYYDLGKYAFGPKLGPWVVLPQQLIVQVGCDIVYMVTGGKCLKNFMEIACTNCVELRQSYWIIIFGSIHFFLSQLPNFNSVSAVSLAAAVMSLSYSTIAWVGCLAKGQIENVNYGYKKTSNVDFMFRVFNALGQISFAYAGHAVVLEIQATMPSTPERPSKVSMWKGALGSYFVNALCYFPVAFIGYWAFGQDVDDNVLVGLKKPGWLIASANLMVVIHVIGSYQVYAMPIFDMLENLMINKLKFPPGLTLRLITRTIYVGLTLFLGVTFPFFGDLLGFFGGFGFAPTAYFLPCVIWLVIKKPKRFSASWFINWACIIIGVLIMLASTIGGLRNIVMDSSSYCFYS
ncbi:lysine histidine transporter-like 6 isoform X2 [Chenopodium quinoa]|uniref:Amino acid transporter transmembrane domain-containing protein n=2 Tax=Chenopodium quinoa TaxID=63459 RepID=A0A803KV52_CHEQI|nr:lysine histidine transporter-like 6 isoform X2 [Chenopodium quinoa]